MLISFAVQSRSEHEALQASGKKHQRKSELRAGKRMLWFSTNKALAAGWVAKANIAPGSQTLTGSWRLRWLPAAREGKCSQLEAQPGLFGRPCFTPCLFLTLFSLLWAAQGTNSCSFQLTGISGLASSPSSKCKSLAKLVAMTNFTDLTALMSWGGRGGKAEAKQTNTTYGHGRLCAAWLVL